ncbi:MAG: ATP-binding cassette domain-containing protein [Dehalococcoidia bacterium]
MAAISAHALARTFPPDIKAVAGIDLNIAAGQVFGFLGQNGSGKTTTVRMLTTLLRPTAGTAEVDGLDVTKHGAEIRQRIGVALQEAGLDEVQTGRELLILQGRLFGMASREAKARAAELLRVVDLEDAADRRVGTYSGGMKRRLDLAAALVNRPTVLFLDEPTTGLDPISRESVWRYVQLLNQEQGLTVFLTTQYLEEADRLCHEIAIMDSGKIVAEGTPAALKATIGADVVTVRPEGGIAAQTRAAELLRRLPDAEEVREDAGSVVVYIRDGARAIPRVVLLLDEAGIALADVNHARPTLDDVFLRSTGHHIEVDAPVAAAAGGERR